ncbi:hypothetical protein, partial [Psychrobacter sp. CAL346-MNA-CIBAN-0220]|uniref:hypothetical protein n=1 Tax=Psychrobacter sp. CAL346-MNA-CIBAN-0220 TaxID=3140457 RepID=UPI003326065A
HASSSTILNVVDNLGGGFVPIVLICSVFTLFVLAVFGPEAALAFAFGKPARLYIFSMCST